MRPITLLAYAITIQSICLVAQEPSSSMSKTESFVVQKVQPGLRPSESFLSWIGKPTPDVKFTDLQGKEWSLSSLKGKTLYINIWFTGCAPCVTEIPDLNAIHSKTGSNPDLVMLSIAYDDEQKVRSFLKSKPINFPVACVPFEVLKKLAMPASSVSFPTHLIFNRKGILVVASNGGSKQISQDLEFSISQALQ